MGDRVWRILASGLPRLRSGFGSSNGEGGRIEIWRRSQDEFVSEKSWLAHGDRLVHVTFSDDGLLLASSSEDCSLKCWESRTGELVSARLLSEAARSLSFWHDFG